MKKILFIILLMIISISNVYALTDEEELQSLINKVPDSYNLTVEERVEINDNGALASYVRYNIKNILKKNNIEVDSSNSPYTLSLVDYNGNYKLELSNLKNCYVEKEKYYSWCDSAISVVKNISINIEYISDFNNDFTIEKIKGELDQREIYNNYEKSIGELFESYDIISTIKQIKTIASKYSVELDYISRKGSTLLSDDKLTETGWNAGNMFIIMNNIIYANIYMGTIDNTINYKGQYFNYYYPKLKISDYDDVDEYIDDALIDFPSKAHLTNYEVIIREDGKRYTKRTEDDNDYYEVLIKDLDDNVEWNMYFNGKLKVKPTNIKGDMNNNGRIDLKDIIILIRTYLGLE